MENFDKEFETLSTQFTMVQDIIRQTRDILNDAGNDLSLAKMVMGNLVGKDEAEDIVATHMSKLNPRGNRDLIWNIIEDGRKFTIANEIIDKCNDFLYRVTLEIKSRMAKRLEITPKTDVDAYNEILRDSKRVQTLQYHLMNGINEFDNIDPDIGCDQPGDWLFETNPLENIGNQEHKMFLGRYDFHVFEQGIVDSAFKSRYDLFKQVLIKYEN
jgi:hypothetical protein